MSDFDAAYKKSMGNEGNYANNPADRGGETVSGISRKNWPQWSGWKLVDSIKSTLLAQPVYGTHEYRNWVNHLNSLLTASVAIQNQIQAFYRANFWGRLAEIIDQRVAEESFDKRINCGDIACKWLQRAAGVTDDGIIGTGTIIAVNAFDPAILLTNFNEQAKSYYEKIIERDPSQAVFRHSWFSRLKNYDGSDFVA